ncbi:MAG TPA: hypothetical protein VNT79_11275 [Phycisphaerae bacterium]|nr:hypothetical protein [Phycisphaerae bacterium]
MRKEAKTPFIGRTLQLIAGGLLSCSSSIQASEITVDLWVLSTGVSDSSTNQNDSEGTDTVQNPYLVTHQTSLPVGAATTSHDLSWDSSFGYFLIEATHSLRDVPTHSAYAASSGSIIFHSSSDLLIDLSAFYTYQGLGPEFTAGYGIQVVDRSVTPQVCYFCDGAVGGPGMLQPPNGSFSTSTSAILPADHSFRITYLFRLSDAIGTGTSAVGTADGGLSFTLTAIPEPSVCAHLLPFAAALIYRRKRG